MKKMNIQGIAKKDKRTKNLIPRLKVGDIAVIDHVDIDRVCAEDIAKKGVYGVINASLSCTGRFFNPGPGILLKNKILVIDGVGKECFEKIKEGKQIKIVNNKIFQDGNFVGEGNILTEEILNIKMEEAKKNLDKELSSFVENTLSYFKKEKDILFEDIPFPNVGIDIKNKNVIVVARGPDYQKDLLALSHFIRDKKPIIIAVDGGADAVLEIGEKPHIIIGDMDSVSEKALTSGAKIIVHAYPSGEAPGKQKVEKLNVNYFTVPFRGTSEDAALLFAYQGGAEMIIGVGMHFSLIEFLEKGRKGMASTFLARLKVGSILFDAKGVSKLYSPTPKVSLFISLIIAGIVPILIILLTSPQAKPFLRLIRILIERKLGI